MTQDTIQPEKPIPAPPDDSYDEERLDAAQERWDVCPLRDCKKNVDLLYEDFHLRDVRTNRVMCSQCAVHTEIGYMAREIVTGSTETDPYDGTRMDYLLVFFTTFIMSAGLNSLLFYANFILIALFIGIVGGLLIGQSAKRLTLKRVGRFTGWLAILGIILGHILAPINFFVFYGFFAMVGYGAFTLPLLNAFVPILPGIIATGLMAFTAFLSFLKR